MFNFLRKSYFLINSGHVIRYSPMGINSSRLWQLLRFSKSPDTYKRELENINKEILELETTKAALQYQYAMVIEHVISYSRLLYLMCVLAFLFSSSPSTLIEYVLFLGPLLIFYILIYGLKKSLKWYFENEIKRKTKVLLELQYRKKNILTEVKERVKFKEARDIIAEYSSIKQVNVDFRKQINNIDEHEELSISKVVDYVLGEDDQNALICQYCKCHNGMALDEEFHNITFRCCQCFVLNQPMTNKSSTNVKK